MKKNGMQNQNLEEDHIKIIEQFNKGFHQVYRHMEPSIREGILLYAPIMFSKWYSSTLVPETLLSPSNIISTDNRLALKRNEVAAYCLKVTNGERQSERFSYAINVYSVKNHPLLSDIKVILNHCHPDIPMNLDGSLTHEDTAEILSKLSMPDKLYLDYIMLLLWHMGLLKKLPAIYSARMQPFNADEFLALSNIEQLKKLAYAALDLAIMQIHDAMHIDFELIPYDFFLDYLKSSQDVGSLFDGIFQLLGIDIDDIWNDESDNLLSENDEAVMSSFYYVGILLDKCFITPMGYYFHAIEPIYFTPFHFIHVINNLTSLLTIQGDASLELYSPCSYYSQTVIGLEIFGYNNTDAHEHSIPENIDFEQLLMAVTNHIKQTNRLMLKIKRETPQQAVYVFKARYIAQKRRWKVIELTSSTDLETFCDGICSIFNMEEVVDYTLTSWDHNQFPVKFSPETSKRSVNKVHTKKLEDLSLVEGDKLMFNPIPNKNKQLDLELTLIKISIENPYVIYPRIKKQSSYITEAEKMEDLF